MKKAVVKVFGLIIEKVSNCYPLAPRSCCIRLFLMTLLISSVDYTRLEAPRKKFFQVYTNSFLNHCLSHSLFGLKIVAYLSTWRLLFVFVKKKQVEALKLMNSLQDGQGTNIHCQLSQSGNAAFLIFLEYLTRAVLQYSPAKFCDC